MHQRRVTWLDPVARLWGDRDDASSRIGRIGRGCGDDAGPRAAGPRSDLRSLFRGELQFLDGNIADLFAFTNAIAASDIGSFTANFTFELDNVGSTPQADGLAFVVQDVGTNFLGGYGGNLGLAGAGGDSAAVVFQSWVNDHASIVTDGNPYGGTQAVGNFALGYNSQNTVSADVTFNGSVLSVSAVNETTGATYNDSLALDVAGLRASVGNVYFGFTSGTGSSTSLTQVDSFSLNVSPVPLPPGLLMFGSALAALGLFGLRRGRREAV
jgi:hypothetical protein